MAILSSNELILAALLFIFVVWTKRILWMSRVRRTNPPLEPSRSPVSGAPPPKISIIVPARNEEKNIPNCLLHLCRQTYPRYEIIVVDDRSEDRTPELLEEWQRKSPVPLKIVRIEKLPAGWTGKNYAMFTGSKAASGEWFLFTDADTTHSPSSVETAAACAVERKIDFLTLAPQTESKSFWEKTVQPLAVGSLALWFPPEKVNDPRSEVTLANGQFILVRKEVYEKTGGNESVQNEVVEDVELAKKVRGAGFSVQFLNGTLLYSTRMYSSLKEIRTGWTRIFTYLFNKKPLPILHKIFMFLLFSIFPFLTLFAEAVFKLGSPQKFSEAVFYASLGVSVWIAAIRFIGNKLVKSNPWYALLHPLGSLIMVWILASSLWRILFKKPSVWRGTLYR
ncbi:MAG: glycosyltransferase [Candidatus Omnitrophica bacterium]|nr:glycosyltransferase [Candidatus Omnitrophota bacterium]